MKTVFGLCLCFFFMSAAMAQKGEWYTWSTGTSPAMHITIDGDEIVLDQNSPYGKQGGINGRTNKNDGEHLKIVKRMEKNDKVYLIFESFDGLYFLTAFKKAASGDSIYMYCADGVDDGYKGLSDAMMAVDKDKGSSFYITLFKKEVLDAEKRKGSVSKISLDEFATALQDFNNRMDLFWKDRGYGHYEPYHRFMNLIYGNAFANAFPEKYSKLSLVTKELKTPINNYSKNTTVKRLLESAGFLKTE